MMPPKLIFAMLSLTLAPALGAETTPQAGFDCAKAESGLERAICADPETAEADRAMTVAFRALLTQAGSPEFIAALKADQRSYLAIRQQIWEGAKTPQLAQERLRDETERRAEHLSWINPTPEATLLGTWANAWGVLHLTETADSILQLEGTVTDQVAGRWICGYDGGLVTLSPSEAIGHTLTEELKIRRDGSLLQIATPFCDETGPAINGSMQGLYFRIGAEG